MKVIKMNRAILLALIVVALASISGGSAQEGVPNVPAVDTMGDLSARVPREDLDSYWSDTSTWAFYGYRPHTQLNQTRFMGNSMPSYFAGKNSYSFGTNSPPANVSLSGGLNKDNIQMTGGGTWH